MANLKAQPNREIYLRILRGMTPEQKLATTLELSAFIKRLFITGLQHRHPTLSDEELRGVVLERLNRCHNRNY